MKNELNENIRKALLMVADIFSDVDSAQSHPMLLYEVEVPDAMKKIEESEESLYRYKEKTD